MHYFLTKADTVRRRDDLHKVVVQVTQNLAPRLANNHGFQVPTIWIPDPDGVTGGLQLDPELNGIHKLCVTIRDTVRAKVQANLTVAQKDCEVVASKVGDVRPTIEVDTPCTQRCEWPPHGAYIHRQQMQLYRLAQPACCVLRAYSLELIGWD